TLSNILKIEQEYKTKMSNIEKNHQTLKDQIEKFDNPERALENKDYFEIPEQIDSATFNYMPNTQNFNPEIVL
ncbi:MAG: hypothetical protein KAQ63_01350, partial [Candidatus Moranbacteria bacterium]|nr:hypothetical protein [Candidatus Moranbacteria bacterium]